MIYNIRAVEASAFGVAVPKARVKTSARPSVKAGFKVTLETPDGTKAFDCDADTYILEAAEVRTIHEPCDHGKGKQCRLIPRFALRALVLVMIGRSDRLLPCCRIPYAYERCLRTRL